MNPRITFGAAGLLFLSVLTAGGVAVAASPSSSTPSSASSSSASSSSAGEASAGASTGTSAGKDIVLPAGGVLAKRTAAFCERSDTIVDRLTARQAKIAGRDAKAVAAAKAKGEKRVAALREHNYDKRADAVQKRIDRRAKRVAALPDRLATVKAAAAECSSLGLN